MPSKLIAFRRLPQRYAHFVYGAIQSFITTGVATGVATMRDLHQISDLAKWTQSWIISWLLMIPVVLLAAPTIQRLTSFFVRTDR